MSVIGVGWVMHDFVSLVRKYPIENTKTESLVEEGQVGGPVSRALSVLASLGVATTLGAVVGDDSEGATCKRFLETRGIDLGGLQIVPGGRTRHSHVWVSSENGSRTIVYERGDLPSLSNSSYLGMALGKAEILHLDGRELEVAVPLAERMHGLQKVVIVDGGGWKPGLEELLAYTRILILPESTLTALHVGDVRTEARNLRRRFQLQALVVTAGERGTLLVTEQETSHVPADVVRSVDTHGAGDVFAGGLIYGLLRDCTEMESVKLGSRLAALSCERFGDFFPERRIADEFVSAGVIS